MNFKIDPTAVYVTPTGRRCRWLPLGGSRGAWTAFAHFEYVNGDHQLKEGFCLAPENYRILRKEVCDAPGR